MPARSWDELVVARQAETPDGVSACRVRTRRTRTSRPSRRHLVLGVASAAVALLACVTSARADTNTSPSDQVVVSYDNGNGGTAVISGAGTSQDPSPGSTSEQPVAPQLLITLGLAGLPSDSPPDVPSAAPNPAGATANPGSAPAASSANDADIVGTGVPQPEGSQNPQNVPAPGGATDAAGTEPGQANATAISVQTNPANSSVTVVIGTPANTQGATQSNTAEATAAANTSNVAPPEAAAGGANQAQASGSGGDQATVAELDAGNGRGDGSPSDHCPPRRLPWSVGRRKHWKRQHRRKQHRYRQ